MPGTAPLTPNPKTPELVNGISAIGDVVKNEPVVPPAPKRRRQRRTPKPTPVTITQPQYPGMWQLGVEIAGGDFKRVETQKDGSVIIWNNPRRK